jgi:two-component system sensor histidine kinase KdpD
MTSLNELRKRMMRRPSWFAAVAVNIVVTLSLLVLHSNATVAAMLYLVSVVWFAAVAGRTISIYLAVTSSLLFDFYFLEPLHSLLLSGQSWLAMTAFVVSCVVVARVAERARLQTLKAEQRRADVECLNNLSQEMMLHGDARDLIHDIPRLIEQVFALEAVRLYVLDDDQTYSSVPGNSHIGKVSVLPTSRNDPPEGYSSVDLVFGMKSIGTLAWKSATISREVATSVATQVAIAITRAHAIEASARLEAARSADRLRGALIDSLTHELRTPLTVIRAATTTLLDWQELDDGTRTEFITIVDEESLRLDELIGEAMEMAQIDSDGIRVKSEPVYTGTFLEHVVQELYEQLSAHEVSIVVDKLETPNWFDPHLISRVVHHLLENAARYTPPGSRIVICSSQTPERIEFSVEDDGPGIDAHDLPQIFDKFYRGKHRTLTGKGSGMGLAICRSIIAAHGGVIEVDSTLGQGTVFRFWLPVIETIVSTRRENSDDID